MADLLCYGLYLLGAALFVVVSACLALTLYIIWSRRGYAHIPSPAMPRFVSTITSVISCEATDHDTIFKLLVEKN